MDKIFFLCIRESRTLEMHDKHILITGATSGIGKAAAMELARRGAKVVITYRDRERGENALREIRELTGNREAAKIRLDLASLTSVREMVSKYRERFERLDVLINNAGGYFGYRKFTEEGYEYTFGVNHLGHFLLTNLLRELLISGRARIINVSSQAQMAGHIHFDDLMLENRFSGFRAYAQAKMANIIFTYELDRRWGNEGITANAMHPGAVATNFGKESRPLFRGLIRMGKPFLKSPEKGARTIVYLASSPGVEGISGKYFAYGRQIRSRALSYRQDVWKRLWEVSEELTVEKQT